MGLHNRLFRSPRRLIRVREVSDDFGGIVVAAVAAA